MIESPFPRRRDTPTEVLRAGARQPLAITGGYRESARSWRELPLDLKRRGQPIGPELATGDGALGF